MVKFLHMRQSVLDALRTLADAGYQQRMWVEERDRHPGTIEDLDQNIHILYDDTDVADSPYQQIGLILRNTREAEVMQALDIKLGPLYDSLPAGIDDASVIALPEWQEVIAAAQTALQVFCEPDVV